MNASVVPPLLCKNNIEMDSIIFETADMALILGPVCTTREKLENGVFILKIFLSTLRQRNMKVQQLLCTKLGQGIT